MRVSLLSNELCRVDHRTNAPCRDRKRCSAAATPHDGLPTCLVRVHTLITGSKLACFCCRKSQARLVARSLKPSMLFREQLHFPAEIPGAKSLKHRQIDKTATTTKNIVPINPGWLGSAVAKLLQKQHDG